MENINVTDYTPANRPDLMWLLMELHGAYFAETASKQFLELRQEKHIAGSYEKYLDQIEEEKEGWKILLASTEAGAVVGMIIGSISVDDDLVLGKTGQFEDWYVEPHARGRGIGLQLYQELEKWFKERGCQQVASDTWQGNELSIKAHEKMGFFVSGIKLSKKI